MGQNLEAIWEGFVEKCASLGVVDASVVQALFKRAMEDDVVAPAEVAAAMSADPTEDIGAMADDGSTCPEDGEVAATPVMDSDEAVQENDEDFAATQELQGVEPMLTEQAKEAFFRFPLRFGR